MADPNSPNEFSDELLSAYLDDALSSKERVQVEQHLLAHPEAQKQIEQMRVVSSLVRRLPPQPVREDLRKAVLARIAKQQDETEHMVKPKLTIGRSPRGWIWAGLAVAASIALMIYQERSDLNQPNSDIAQRSVRGLQNSSRDLEWTNPQSRGNSRNEPFDEIAAGSSSSNKAPTSSAKPLADAQKENLVGAPAQLVELDDSPILVVHIVMPANARRNRAFEKLLESEGLIDRADLADFRELKTANRVLTNQGTRLRFGVSADDVDGKVVEKQKRGLDRVPKKSADFSAEPEGTPADPRATGDSLADDGGSVEVIMVEAPEADVLSCLEKLQRDEQNYLAIEVDVSKGQLDSRPVVRQKDTMNDSQLAEDLSWIGLQQFNRGQIPPGQRARQPIKPAMRLPPVGEATRRGSQGIRELSAAEPIAAKAQRKAIAQSGLVGDNPVQVVFVLGTTAPPGSVSAQPGLREDSPGEAVQPE